MRPVSAFVVCAVLSTLAKYVYGTYFRSLVIPYSNLDQEIHACTALEFDPEVEENVVAFDPIADPQRVLHLSLQICDDVPDTSKIWPCGDKVPGCLGDIRPIYVWGQNATKWTLPDNSGIPIGGEAGGRYLVMQAHLIPGKPKGSKPINNELDQAEIQLEITKERKRFEVGLLILGSTGFIPAENKYFVSESACEWPSEQHGVVIGYRLHTHGLGRWVSGFRVRGEDWQILGEGRPQLPENVHPVRGNIAVRKGDILAARCYFENNQNRRIRFGSASEDEMCNFHLLYLIPHDSHHSLRFWTCADDAQNFQWKNVWSSFPKPREQLMMLEKESSQTGY